MCTAQAVWSVKAQLLNAIKCCMDMRHGGLQQRQPDSSRQDLSFTEAESAELAISCQGSIVKLGSSWLVQHSTAMHCGAKSHGYLQMAVTLYSMMLLQTPSISPSSA